ncbi:nitrile hydratase subunit alpha [Paraburkholderia caledonica]|uniref:nitrile hydratase subunit alpha n=1 Tax=Paraburkholderia caledonica TaxID=134536 RepID=UPI0038BBD22E
MDDPFHLPINELHDIFVNCWTDSEFQEKFLSDPHAVLAEWGIDLPPNVQVKVSQDSPDLRHVVIPLPPDPSEVNMKAIGSPVADSCVMSACRPCASYKDRGTIARLGDTESASGGADPGGG